MPAKTGKIETKIRIDIIHKKHLLDKSIFVYLFNLFFINIIINFSEKYQYFLK